MQPEQGLSTLDKAFVLVKETGEHLWEAELYRLQGELLLIGDDEIGAEASFQKAIELARQQCAKSWELRATISLARLWKSQGKREQADEVLGKIYNWFIEGYDSPDLIMAKPLLEALR